MSRVMCTLDLGSNSDTGLFLSFQYSRSVGVLQYVCKQSFSSDTTAPFEVCDVSAKA